MHNLDRFSVVAPGVADADLPEFADLLASRPVLKQVAAARGENGLVVWAKRRVPDNMLVVTEVR